MPFTLIKRLFYNNVLLRTVHMKVSNHLENILFLLYIILYNFFSFRDNYQYIMARKLLHLRWYCQILFHSKKFVFSLSIFQIFKNWVSKEKLKKSQKCSKYFQCKIRNTHLRYCGKTVQFSKDFRADSGHKSQKFIVIFIKNLLKNTSLCSNSNV